MRVNEHWREVMSKNIQSWIKYLKFEYYTWMAETYHKRSVEQCREYERLLKLAKEYEKRVRELVEEM